MRGYRVEGAKQVAVAVLGFENTGKSSVINAVVRSALCGVSETAGYTKEVRLVHVTEVVKMFDSPGIPSMPSHPGPHITLPLEQAKETSQPHATPHPSTHLTVAPRVLLGVTHTP